MLFIKVLTSDIQNYKILVIPAFADMVKGYPSLVWVPKGDKQNPQKYSGGRSIEDFRSWISENGSGGKKEEL